MDPKASAREKLANAPMGKRQSFGAAQREEVEETRKSPPGGTEKNRGWAHTCGPFRIEISIQGRNCKWGDQAPMEGTFTPSPEGKSTVRHSWGRVAAYERLLLTLIKSALNLSNSALPGID